jgi:hypothetical protein
MAALEDRRQRYVPHNIPAVERAAAQEDDACASAYMVSSGMLSNTSRTRKLGEHRPTGVYLANDARAAQTGLVSSRAAATQKITPRASRQHFVDPPSPPTHSTRCCSGRLRLCFHVPSATGPPSSKAGRRALPAGPCTITVYPLFAATRRSRIGQL